MDEGVILNRMPVLLGDLYLDVIGRNVAVVADEAVILFKGII